MICIILYTTTSIMYYLHIIYIIVCKYNRIITKSNAFFLFQQTSVTWSELKKTLLGHVV